MSRMRMMIAVITVAVAGSTTASGKDEPLKTAPSDNKLSAVVLCADGELSLTGKINFFAKGVQRGEYCNYARECYKLAGTSYSISAPGVSADGKTICVTASLK